MEPLKVYRICEYIDEPGDLDNNMCNQAFCGLVYATEEQIEAFLKKWNKPRIYGYNYHGELTEHRITAYEVAILPIEGFEPYKKEHIDQPDLPMCGRFRDDSEYCRYEYIKEEDCWINLDRSKKYNWEGEPLC